MKSTTKLPPIILLVCSIIVCSSMTTRAQDIHFTNYQVNPTVFNASNIGLFSGDLKVSGIYRNQFSSFYTNPSEAYVTLNGGLEASFSLGFSKNHWTSIGVNYLYDVAGATKVKHTGMQLGLAYHMPIMPKSKMYNTVISLGFQYGRNNLKLSEFLVDNTNDPLPQSWRDRPVNFGSYTGGFSLRRTTKKSGSFIHIDYGMTVFSSFTIGSEKNTRSTRQNASMIWHQWLGKNFALRPSIYTSIIGKETNFMAGSQAHYRFNKEHQTTAILGLNYRIGDAMLFTLGGEYDQWLLLASFDLTTSSASVYNNSQGAFEVGLTKIIGIKKKPQLKPIILCPRL